jgi:WD40 repeat protein
VFSPQSSLVKAAFQHCSPSWLLQSPITAKTWDTNALTLEAEGSIAATAFSPDDKYIATCSDNEIVRVWDPETGVCLSMSDATQKEKVWPVWDMRICKFLAFSSCNSLAKASFSAVNREEPTATRIFKIDIYHSVELRDTKEMTCTVSGAYAAELAFSPKDHDILYAAVSGNTNGMITLDMWRVATDIGTMECIWSRSTSDNLIWVLSVSVELGLVVCRLDDTDYYSLDLVDLYTGVSMRKVELMSHLIREGPSIIHGTDLIIAISDLRTGPSSLKLHCFNIQTEQQQLVDSSPEDYRAFALAHRSDRLVTVSRYSKSAEIRNASRESATTSMPWQDSIVDLNISVDGETLLVAYSDRFEVQDLRGGIAFARPAIWSRADFPMISRSHDGIFIAARTRTAQTAHGITVWRTDTGSEVFRPCVTHGLYAGVFSHSTELLVYDDEKSERLIVWDISGATATLTFDIPEGTRLRELQFAPDDKTLFTSDGFVRIDTQSGVWTPERMALTETTRSGIFYERDWILSWSESGREDLMWVPPRYRPVARYGSKPWTFDASDHTIALWNPDSMLAMRIADPTQF